MTADSPANSHLATSPALRATGWMALAAVSLAVSAMLIRTAGQTLDPFVIVFFRTFLAVVLMAPFLFWPRPVGIVPKRPGLLAFRAVFAFLTMTSWFSALTYLPTGEAVALNFTAPMFTTVLAALFIGERIRAHRITAVLFGLVGVLVILQPGFDTITVFHILPLVAALAMAVGAVSVRRLTRDDHPNVIIFYTSLFVLPLVAPFANYFWRMPEGREWLLLIAIAATTTLTHQCLTRAFRAAEASFVTGVSFLRLPFSILAAWLVFDEWPEGAIWIGGAIIVAANVYIAHREMRAIRG